MKKLLFLSDCHVPYQNKQALDLVLRFAKAWKPNTIIVMGDLCDFYSVSRHLRDPNRVKLDYEINQTKTIISRLDDLGCQDKVFIAGNHESRLERYLMERAPELFNLVRVRDLLGLTSWEYVSYKSHYQIGKVYITHDVGASGKYATHKALDAFQDNVVTGHTHRLQYIVEGNAKGKPHVSASFGWLGDPKKADYMHRIKASRDWALGFGIGYLLDNGNVHLQPVPIVQGKILVEGKVYE